VTKVTTAIMSMKASELTLVRGGKLPQEALRWLEEVERVFPGTTKDLITIRTKPISANTARAEAGYSQRERETTK
jgi:hypothetical protein